MPLEVLDQFVDQFDLALGLRDNCRSIGKCFPDQGQIIPKLRRRQIGPFQKSVWLLVDRSVTGRWR